MAKKIMIVDNNIVVVKVVKAILASQGYHTMEAFSGEECLQKIQFDKPDLIFLSEKLPEMDGWKIVSRIREDYGLREIPLVMLASEPLTRETLDREKLDQVNDYLAKHFSKEDLMACVRESLK
jgi:CheY-like chemotaxis protein